MKRLLGGTIAIILFILLVTTSWAADIGQTCIMPKGIHAVQIMQNPFQPLRGVLVPEDETVTITGYIMEEHNAILKANDMNDYDNAFVVEFGHDFEDGRGEQILKIIVRQNDLKDCK